MCTSPLRVRQIWVGLRPAGPDLAESQTLVRGSGLYSAAAAATGLIATKTRLLRLVENVTTPSILANSV